jgi:hypothetical protein
MHTDDKLRDSLISAERLSQGGADRAEAEPAAVTAGGLVASYRGKIRPAAELLERRGHIDWRQSRACRRLYRAYALGIIGAREQNKGCSAWSPAGYSDLQLSAAADYREARAAVVADWELIFHVAVMDFTVQRYCAEQLGSSSGRMIGLTMGRLRTALDRLADHYAAVDATIDRSP